jgi:surfactin synthase thioesterase subunit
MNTMRSSPWLLGTPQAGRKLRLYCFAYAGGGAHAYLPWQRHLGPDIEVCAVQLPGRGTRMAEPPCTSMDELVLNLAQVLSTQERTPFAFFGHSLGALVAFELARFCARHALPMPQRLIVSGASAPRGRTPRHLHTLSDAALIDALRDYDGSPPEVLADRELMALLLPMIRADFTLGETYAYRPGPLLNLPITVLAGKADGHGAVASASNWCEETRATCTVHSFEGGHFFIQSAQDAVLACLRATLAAPEALAA